MMGVRFLALAASLWLLAPAMAVAADMPMAPAIDEADPSTGPEPEVGSDWYLRGDIGYADLHKIGLNADWGEVDRFSDQSLNSTWTVGGGFGYDFGWFRADLTGDYFNKTNVHASGNLCATSPTADSCSSNEKSSLTNTLFLANVYFDLGTWGGLTPYVGAGVGAADVQWNKWTTTATCVAGAGDCDAAIFPDVAGGTVTATNTGADKLRFAYAFMAGASYALGQNLSLDFGYRFTDIADGKSVREFADTNGVQKGGGVSYKDLYAHQFRVGLRYTID